MSDDSPFSPPKPGLGARLRLYLLSGLLVLGPTAVTLWVLAKAFQWADGLLGRYLTMYLPWLQQRHVPGLGLLAMLLLLLLTGWIASRLAGLGAVRAGERVLSRLPVFGSIYTPTKQLGEAFLGGRRAAIHHVVLVQWPHAGAWRIGFVTGTPPRVLSERVGCELTSVFVPSTPNPTSGFFHLFPSDRVIVVDLTVEQGIQMVASGGVVRPSDEEIRRLPEDSHPLRAPIAPEVPAP